jgi:hypothetical protein
VELPAEVARTPKILSEIVKRFEVMAPFIEYLDAALRPPKRKMPDALTW